MNCQAYLKDGLLCVGFNQSSLVFSGIQYPLGDGATNFSMFPERIYRMMFGQFRAEFLLSIENQETEKELLDTLRGYVEATGGMNPYFNFYMDFYTFFLLCLRAQRSEIPKLLRSFVVDGELWDIDSVDFTDASESSLWAAGLLIEDIKTRQIRLKEDYEAITGGAKELAGLNPMQWLYLLSKQGRNYLSGEFRTTLAADYSPMPEDDLGKIKSALLENKVDVVEMVEIKNLDDLLRFELYHTLKADMLIRRCKHCGEFFIVRGRIDTEYCDRVKEGETKPCSIIGATRSYWGSKNGDAVYTEFQKAYKRNHSRQRVGKMTNQEFYEWSEEARRKRGECEAGRLSLEEFRVWLGNKKLHSGS